MPARLLLVSALVVSSFSKGCLPVFQQYQGARVLEPGDHEITPHFSYVSFTNDGETEHMQNQIGIRVATGATPKADLRLNYTRILMPNADFGYQFVTVGPKFKLREGDDKFALFVPVDFAFGEEIETSDSWALQPTILGTYKVSDDVNVNPGAMVRIPLTEGEIFGDALISFNLGFGINAASGSFKLRPEAAMVFEPGESGLGWSFGLGASFSRQ